ncbi:MAG: hypothetical protein IPL36_13280 [Nigerium sp.]|nr:hypothetical protein [Nigerium sp.]
MTTTAEYPLRTGRLRRAGALVKVPRLVIAALLWLVLTEALPGLAAWVVLVVVLGGTVAAVVAEPMVVVRLLWWARRPSTPIGVPGDPQVRVLVTRRGLGGGIGQAGRRHLVVPAAWVNRADLPELLGAARRRQLVASGAFDVAYQWFTWPWQVLAAFGGGFARGVARLPLVGFAWRVRFVVAGIAVWQTLAAGQYPATVGILVVMGLTYLLPWTTAHEEHLIRQALAGAAPPVATSEVRRPEARRGQRASVRRRACARAPRDTSEPCGQ